jgi:hypothetical protein
VGEGTQLRRRPGRRSMCMSIAFDARKRASRRSKSQNGSGGRSSILGLFSPSICITW